MKKEVTKIVHCCDACGAAQDYGIDLCLGCGAEHCSACKKTHGVEYKHGVNFSGSDDGYYCHQCDARLTKSGEDKLHCAYRQIARLRVEGEAFSADFRKRVQTAEADVQECRVGAKARAR